MQELSHVPHLLGHGVTVHNKYDGTGGATELVNNLSIIDGKLIRLKHNRLYVFTCPLTRSLPGTSTSSTAALFSMGRENLL